MASRRFLARLRGRVWAFVLETDRFVRLHFLFFTCVWPLLGAASVHADSSWTDLSVLLAVMLCFHVFAFVLNDVVDLPIDRTHVDRQRDPLVRGVITPQQALAVVLLQPVLAVPLTMLLGPDWHAYAALASSFALMGTYNLFGKRCALPPAMDLIQGLGWGSLAIYAAYALGSEPNPLTWMVLAYGTGFTLFMNGIHGGLRDLANDVACGAHTTAIYLGARPSPNGADSYVPRQVAIFASAVLAGLVGLNAALMLRNDFHYGPAALTVTATVVAALNLGAIALMPKVVRPHGPVWNVAFRLQMYLVLMSLPAAFGAYASPKTLALLLLLTVISVMLLEWTPAITRWVWLIIHSAVRSASGDSLEAWIPDSENRPTRY